MTTHERRITMQKKTPIEKYIVLGVVVAIIIGLITALQLGKKQDEQFTMNQMQFNYAQQLMEEERYETGVEMMAEVMANSTPTAYLTQSYGYMNAYVEDYQKASELYLETIEINPYMIENALFMAQLSEFLVVTEQYDKALTVIEQAETLNPPEQLPNYQEILTNLKTKTEAALATEESSAS